MPKSLLDIDNYTRFALLTGLKDDDKKTVRNQLEPGVYKIDQKVHILGILEIGENYARTQTNKPAPEKLLGFIFSQMSDEQIDDLKEKLETEFRSTELDPLMLKEAEICVSQLSNSYALDCSGRVTGQFEIEEIKPKTKAPSVKVQQ